MSQSLYQIDAFTSRLFAGNPAAVCPLDEWLPDAVMQAIAAENNLAETAFFVRGAEHYSLRWFTPAAEVDLCGHATLASAWLLFHELGHDQDQVVFETRSGALTVVREGEALRMDFPAQPATPREPPAALIEGLGVTPREVLAADDYVAVLEDDTAVRSLTPDLRTLAQLDLRGIIVTARGTGADFVSRFFAPAKGVDEDPVTGSAHCTLAPYWRERLGRDRLLGQQLSRRGGDVDCEVIGERVLLRGRCRLYLRGTIETG